MKLNKWLTNGTTATLVMASALASAQSEPVRAQDAPPADEPEVKEPLVRWNELVFGFNSAPINEHFGRYGRIPEGITFQGIKLFTPGDEKFPVWAKFLYRGSFLQDNTMEARLVLNHGNTIIAGSRLDNGSRVFGWEIKGLSEKDSLRLALDHSFAPGLAGWVTYESTKTSGKYAAPRPEANYYTEVVGIGAGAEVLDGNLGVSAASRRISDRTGGAPASRQQKVDATYARDFGDVLSLEGSYGYARTDQAGLASTDTKRYALAGSLNLGPMTGLHFQFGRQDYDFENVQNASIRKRLQTSARLVHRFNSKTSLQLGFKHKETERFRADRTFVDVPKSNEYDARFTTKFGGARVALKGTWEDLTASAAMQTDDTRQMLWDDKALFQAKVDSGNDTISAYGVYTYRFQQNKQRDIDIRQNNLVFGGSYVMNPYMNCYLEFAADNFLVRGGAPELDNWFPNARSATFGFNWSPDITLYTSASLNVFESSDIRGSQLTLSLRKILSESRELELVVAPWRQTDRQFDIAGYRATILSARYMVKF